MNSQQLSGVEQHILKQLDEERDLSEWWEEVQQATPEIRVEQFCAAVKSLTDKELVVLGEGVPAPYFGRPEHFEADERVSIENVEELLETLTSEGSLDEFDF